MRKSNSHKMRTALAYQTTEISRLEEVHSCIKLQGNTEIYN